MQLAQILHLPRAWKHHTVLINLSKSATEIFGEYFSQVKIVYKENKALDYFLLQHPFVHSYSTLPDNIH